MSEGWETEEVPIFRTQTFIFIFSDSFKKCMFTVENLELKTKQKHQ